MALDLTEEQIQVTIRYVVSNMMKAGVAINNPEQVLRWMILNPLPDAETVSAEAAEQEAKEKAKRIELLTKELARLEGN
jgi:hypothetical protein